MKKMGKAIALSTGFLLASSASFSPIPWNLSVTEAASAVKIVPTVYQTTANLNMRTGAGTKYKVIMTIPKGKTVTATERLGDWYKVSYDYTVKGRKYTRTGWVSGDYLKKLTSQSSAERAVKMAVAAPTIYQTTANLNMRTGAGTKYKVIMTIPKGKTVTATERLGDWYKVSYDYTVKGRKYTRTGWVSGDYLKKASSQSPVSASQTAIGNTVRSVAIAKTVYQTTANVNLRTGAGTKYKKIVTIPKGRTVTATEKLGSWYKVSYEYSEKGRKYTKIGWISGSYLREYDQYKNISGTYLFTKTAAVLYSVPKSKGNAVKLAVGNGLYSTRMVINSIGQTWYEVAFNGKKLYVSVNDVTKVTPQRFSQTKYEVKEDAVLYGAPGSAHSRLVTIPKGTVISSSLHINGWYEVTYKGKKGYIYSSELEKYVPAPPSSSSPSNPLNPASAQPNDSSSTITEREMVDRTFAVRVNLNFRKQPDVNADRLAIIPKGTIVVPTHQTSNGWYKIKYDNQIGYVSGDPDLITEVKTGAPLDGRRDGYQFIDLRTQAPVEAWQINKYIQSYVQSTGKQSVLANQGQTFINVGRKYGVNPLYLAAHAIHESAFGTSRLALTKYNLFGYGAYDDAPFVAAYRFSSIEESIEYVARKIKSSYLNPSHPFFKGPILGFRTNTLEKIRVDESSEGMNFYYASDPYWGQTIARHMANMLPYDSNYYKSAPVDKSVPPAPSIPPGSDYFPTGIVAVANSPIPLYDQKGGKQIAVLAKGATFAPREKTNDYWFRLEYNGRQYWTNAIKLYDYARYITVKNLGSVTADTLNVRSTPIIPKIPEENVISKLKMGQYVSLKLKSDGTIEQQGSWYQIVLDDGRTGWVSSTWIIRELK
ncbi:SH3 domain-containing protein [Geobacillus sp. C56-T2]|uniref:SH3 domain-containing protein n=1 Tax=Geobacillus sp. C56-T2 TaxID=600773 RepID=UPI0011AA7CB7|nr:SH3 domain-containing protein [Geobacillus sp. C56-T2]NNV07901.1 peptide-binding protein [Geobacillus sp. MMMUD3]TWG31920.1 Beta- N-acetylglucosaminidase [Geobacillus sp. C56-T2]